MSIGVIVFVAIYLVIMIVLMVIWNSFIISSKKRWIIMLCGFGLIFILMQVLDMPEIENAVKAEYESQLQLHDETE